MSATPFFIQTISPAIPVGISIAVTVLLFVLTRLAMDLMRNGVKTISIKRMAELDPHVLRLSFSIDNETHRESSLEDLQISIKEGHSFRPIGVIQDLPIVRVGEANYVKKSAKGYGFAIPSLKKCEAIIVCTLSELPETAYLVATNEKGRRVAAQFSLKGNASQTLRFRRT